MRDAAAIAANATDEVIVGDVTFTVKALTPEWSCYCIFLASNYADKSDAEQARVVSQQYAAAVEHGLVGWSVDIPFSDSDQAANIAALEVVEFAAIAKRVIALSIPSEEQRKN
jgi:hypothetical protein